MLDIQAFRVDLIVYISMVMILVIFVLRNVVSGDTHGNVAGSPDIMQRIMQCELDGMRRRLKHGVRITVGLQNMVS